MDTLALGLTEIQNSYDKKYLRLESRRCRIS